MNSVKGFRVEASRVVGLKAQTIQGSQTLKLSGSSGMEGLHRLTGAFEGPVFPNSTVSGSKGRRFSWGDKAQGLKECRAPTPL